MHDDRSPGSNTGSREGSLCITSVPVLILRQCERLPILGPSMMPDLRQGKVLAISGASSIGLSRPMKNSPKYARGLFHGLDQQQHAFTVFGTKFNIMFDQRSN